MDSEMINEEYRHARITLSKHQIEEIVPENVIRILDGKKTIFYGSIGERHNLLALAVFSHSELYSREMILEYIVVSEERRLEGIAHELLEYCAQEFKKCQIRSIFVSIAGATAEIARWYDFFVREKYIPVLFCGHVISYHFHGIRQCEMMRYGDALMGAYGRKIKKIEHHLEDSVRQFIHQKTGSYIKQEAYDKEYSRIYWDNEQIAGVFFLKQTDEKTVMLTGLDIEPDRNEKYIFAALLYASLQELCASMDDDAGFTLQLYRPKHYEWAKILLGQPGEDLITQEYVRKL